MTPEQVANAATERLAQRVFVAVDRAAADTADDVRKRVDIPVGRSGGKVIRSKQGESPRREFGNYQKTWTHRTTRNSDVIRGSAGTDSFLGPILEKKLKRPHAQPAAAALRSEVVAKLKSNL